MPPPLPYVCTPPTQQRMLKILFSHPTPKEKCMVVGPCLLPKREFYPCAPYFLYLRCKALSCKKYSTNFPSLFVILFFFIIIRLIRKVCSQPAVLLSTHFSGNTREVVTTQDWTKWRLLTSRLILEMKHDFLLNTTHGNCLLI